MPADELHVEEDVRLRRNWYPPFNHLEPRKGLMIARDKDLKKIIVSNGVVVDKKFMQLSTDEAQASITKHRSSFTLYLFLLPVSKNNPAEVIKLEDAERLRNNPDSVLRVFSA